MSCREAGFIQTDEDSEVSVGSEGAVRFPSGVWHVKLLWFAVYRFAFLKAVLCLAPLLNGFHLP